MLYNSKGHSEVTENFCFLSMSALIGYLRKMKHEHHLYLFNPHVQNGKNESQFKEEIDLDNEKILREEISTKYSGK